MLRKAIIGAVAALLLPLGLVATTPTAASADTHYKKWGTARASDKVLRSGCRDYGYRYRVNRAQRNEWGIEIFFVDPRGRGIAADAKLQGANPPRGRGTFKICRNTTTYGRFKIRMKVTWYKDDFRRDKREGFVEPTFFRMTRPG